jgi:hypothetical protein
MGHLFMLNPTRLDDANDSLATNDCVDRHLADMVGNA